MPLGLAKKTPPAVLLLCTIWRTMLLQLLPRADAARGFGSVGCVEMGSTELLARAVRHDLLTWIPKLYGLASGSCAAHDPAAYAPTLVGANTESEHCCMNFCPDTSSVVLSCFSAVPSWLFACMYCLCIRTVRIACRPREFSSFCNQNPLGYCKCRTERRQLATVAFDL